MPIKFYGTGSFKRFVKDEGGYIFSTGTHNYNDLLSSAHELFLRFDIDTKYVKKIENLFEFDTESDYTLSDAVYYNKIKLSEFESEEVAEFWNETLFNYFNEVSPEGYYFGTSEGDGSCYGWFESVEE